MQSKIKIVLMGRSQAGKSSILQRYINDTFSEEFKSTIGVEFGKKNHTYSNGKTTQVLCWDLTGDKMFQSILEAFYKSTRVVCCVYDVTNLQSFVRTQAQVKEVREANPNALIVIVGNKTDLFEQIKVPHHQASQYAQQNNLLFALTSAKLNTGINELMATIAERIDQLQSSAAPQS